jgi:PAS domain S-box-containing protein
VDSSFGIAFQPAWKQYGDYPEPYVLFQSVRGENGRLADFQWMACNAAAEPLLRGQGRPLSAWRGLEGLPEREALRRVVEQGEALTFELGGPLDGRERWFQARVLKHGDGFELWLSDFTQAYVERRSLREALAHERAVREREAYLSLALETARMVTWEWSEAEAAFRLSANAESFFGLPLGTLGHSFERLLERVAPEERAHIAEVFGRMSTQPGTHTFRFHSQWPDGSRHAYEVVGRSMHEAGQPPRVLGVALECTERERSQEALREAEERYRLASRATNDVLWEWCVRDGRLHWGEACGRVLGYLPEEMGDLDWWMQQVHAEDRDRVWHGLEHMLDSRDEAWSAEYRLRRKDGTYAEVLDRGRAARDGRGVLVRMIGSMMDITERKRALEQLAEEARFRERFIGILGHDLRSPLHAVALSARELRRRGLPPNLQPLAQRIETSAARMGNMISDILDLTRARLGAGIPLHLSPTSLPRVCQQVVEELGTAWPDRLIVVEPEGRCEGVWDWERLAQVVSNLVGNALEHSGREEPVFLRCWQSDGQQLLEISNPGPPIDPVLLRTLFDPFRQGHPGRAGRGGGLGLGLFIVRELVRAHGGEVSVRSEAREGTTFRVALPCDASGTSLDAPAPA